MRLLFVVSEDWYFVSHRLHLAEAAVRAGYEVALLTRVSRHRERIEAAGVRIIDWDLDRRSRNPLKELRALAGVWSALRRFKPDVIHAVALKPVLYSALVSRLTGLKSRVFALGGLGFVFASKRARARLVRPAVLLAFRHAFAGANTRLILQNPDDIKLVVDAGLIDRARVRLIRGAGVDTAAFDVQPDAGGTPIVILPARMLWDKGVGDFVAVARDLRRRGVIARFALVGEPDHGNPECVPQHQLEQWAESGVVEWWGRRDDMPAVLARSHVVCLPTSYGEGVPKSLIEAASSARPIVTYDVPGCREIVCDGDNGYLVPPKDLGRLAQAIADLVADPALRRRMGLTGRGRVEGNFSQETVATQTLATWREALGLPVTATPPVQPAVVAQDVALRPGWRREPAGASLTLAKVLEPKVLGPVGSAGSADELPPDFREAVAAPRALN